MFGGGNPQKRDTTSMPAPPSLKLTTCRGLVRPVRDRSAETTRRRRDFMRRDHAAIARRVKAGTTARGFALDSAGAIVTSHAEPAEARCHVPGAALYRCRRISRLVGPNFGYGYSNSATFDFSGRKPGSSHSGFSTSYCAVHLERRGGNW
jgi:hypothetical protein